MNSSRETYHRTVICLWNKLLAGMRHRNAAKRLRTTARQSPQLTIGRSLSSPRAAASSLARSGVGQWAVQLRRGMPMIWDYKCLTSTDQLGQNAGVKPFGDANVSNQTRNKSADVRGCGVSVRTPGGSRRLTTPTHAGAFLCAAALAWHER
jgi:hypothetical protein